MQADSLTYMNCNSMSRRITALSCVCRSSAVFLPHTPGVVNDIEAQVRNGFMQGNAAAGAPIAPTMQR